MIWARWVIAVCCCRTYQCPSQAYREDPRRGGLGDATAEPDVDKPGSSHSTRCSSRVPFKTVRRPLLFSLPRRDGGPSLLLPWWRRCKRGCKLAVV
uniref:Uncharacterized protein n=1 Tax=Arundo donax TaxID=35708 RepID=A0A0A9BUJ7_ARUDO